MKCPFCGDDDTQVKDSRSSEDGTAIRRRRECSNCDNRFTTFERVQLRDINVIKSDGTKEPFKREKLLRSMNLCLQKRPVETAEIETKASEIVRSIESLGETDVTSRKIGEITMKVIASLDPVAYVRYASVYKDFKDVEDFDSFLDDLKIKYKKA